jgi:hypothetical protein
MPDLLLTKRKTMKRISPTYAISFSLIGLIALITYEMARFNQPNDKDVVLFGGLVTILVSLPAIIATTMLHYKCWRAIPVDIARTSPGIAVGLLFVPFFNFYWYFVSYAGLAEDCAKALGSKGSSRGLGITLGILSITCWTFVAEIPLMIIPLGTAYFVVWLLYTLTMVAGANELAGRESLQASNAAEQGIADIV